MRKSLLVGLAVAAPILFTSVRFGPAGAAAVHHLTGRRRERGAETDP